MLEFKRSLNNKNYLFCCLELVLAFAMGYFLLVGLDKIKNPTLVDFGFSTYTVVTQFGMMIFSIIVINSINMDYREKNILFFKKGGVTALSYFIKKIAVMIFWFALFLLLIYTIISSVYGDFDKYFIMLSYFINVLVYIVVVSGLCGFLCRNILLAYGLNLIIWIVGVVIVAIIPSARFIAYYDASNVLYNDFEQFLVSGNIELLSFREPYIYNVIIFTIALIIVLLTQRVWVKNGVK